MVSKMTKKTRLYSVIDLTLTLIVIGVLILSGLQIYYSSNPQWFVYDNTKFDGSVYDPLVLCDDEVSYIGQSYQLIINETSCVVVDPPQYPYISELNPIYWWVIQNQLWLSVVIFIYAISVLLYKIQNKRNAHNESNI